MTVPPIVERELRVASRLPWTYWLRVVVATCGLLAGCLGLAETQRQGLVTNGTGSGEPIYYLVSILGLLLAGLSGFLFTTDSVSVEKREGTLGLLFLTDLRSHEIILGKFVAHALAALYCQLALVPILGLSLLMGGISMMDCVRMAAALLVVTFASLSLGLLASILTREVQRAVGLNTLLEMGVWGGGFMVYGVLLLLHYWRVGGEVPDGWNDWLLSLNPVTAFMASRSVLPGMARTSGYLLSLGFSGGCGVVALGLATWWLPRSWQDRETRSSRRGLSAWLQRLRFSRPGMAERFRGRLLDVNPVLWLSARHWIRGWLVWGVVIGVLVSFMGLGWEVSRRDDSRAAMLAFLVWSALVIHLVLKSWMANEAPRQFLEDRATGAMELLLTTSLTDREILEGRWRALRRQFLGPMVAVLVLETILLPGVAAIEPDDSGYSLAVALLSMVFLVLDLWAIGWLGLWVGVSGGGRTAASSVMIRIVVLPVVVWIPLMAMSAVGGGGGESARAFILWAVVGTLNSVVWGAWSRGQLEERFREMAIRRRVTRPGVLGWFSRNEKPGSRPGA